VADFVAGHRDRLQNDVVGGEEQIAQPLALEHPEGLHGPRVIPVLRIEKGDEEARVDEDHSRV
jgi:hypothetical protein